MNNIIENASLIITPNAVKTLKLYALKPYNGDGDMAWTRASTATRVNSSLAIESVATGVPRIDYPLDSGCPHILVEPQRTNLYLNSATFVTQNVTTTATDYTVTFYGTGTITFSGTYAGSLVGTGATDRVSLTFTATAGTLTSTLSGTATDAQCEAGGYATSLIVTTGASATRLADTGTSSGVASTFNSVAGVLFIEMAALFDDGTSRYIAISDGTAANRIYIYYDSTANAIKSALRVSSSSQYSFSHVVTDVTDFHKVAVRWAVNDFSFWIDGIEVAIDGSGSVFAADTLNNFSLDSSVGTVPFYGKIRQIETFDYLTDTEMANLTT
jgi:hypothetical protein